MNYIIVVILLINSFRVHIYFVLYLAAGLCSRLLRYLTCVVIFVCHISLCLNSYAIWTLLCTTLCILIHQIIILSYTNIMQMTSKSRIHHNMFLSDLRYILYLAKQELILSCSSYIIAI